MRADSTALGPEDRAAIDTLLRRADDAPDLEAFGRRVVEGLAELYPAISISYNEINPEAQRAFAVILPEPDPEWWAYYQPIFEAHLHEHPYLLDLLAGGDPTAKTWSDLTDVRRFRATELYRRFYEPLGIETQLSMHLPAPDGLVVAVAVNRGREGFDHRDRLVLDALRPHLTRSYRIALLQTERKQLSSVLSGTGWVVVLADDDGRVTASTFDDPTLFPTGGLLPSPLLSRFRSIVGGATPRRGRRPDPVRLVCSTPVTEVAMSAMVMPNPVPPHVVHLRIGSTVPIETLRSLGLTPRQATVAAAMASGATTATIADHLGISPATVKKHLEAIYRTLGVTSRAAAIAALAPS
jgi:DNA-binding CsgD family transcriptional regulator